MNDEVCAYGCYWEHLGRHFDIDIWDRETAIQFAVHLREAGRQNVKLFEQPVPPGPSEETKTRIAERIQRKVNADALLREMTA